MNFVPQAVGTTLGELFQWTSFTDEDEARESSQITTQERIKAEADKYGHPAGGSAGGAKKAFLRRTTTKADDEDCLSEALYMLDAELARIPPDQKRALMEAQERCPDLVGDDFMSPFLWRDDLDAKIAAQRIVRYWEQRRKLFGPGKCFMPLTLQGALREDLAALSQGLIRVLPTKDAAGRAMMLWDPSLHDNTQYSSESMLRACWYTFHAVLDKDPMAQKLGIVLLFFPKNAKLGHFDFQQIRAIMELEENYLPVRFRSIHVCHPNELFHITGPAFKGSLSRRTRQRLVMHFGSNEHVLHRLADYGMPQDCLPSCLGGGIMLDHENWLAQRCISESSKKTFNPLSSGTDISHLHSEISTQTAVQGAQQGALAEVVTKQQVNNLKSSVTQKTKQTSQSSKTIAGRKGDPRMNGAVQAKLAKPHLSLLDALLEGGFVFPGLGTPGTTHTQLFDTSNVSLVQRKNQLMRRVRKQKERLP